VNAYWLFISLRALLIAFIAIFFARLRSFLALFNIPLALLPPLLAGLLLALFALLPVVGPVRVVAIVVGPVRVVTIVGGRCCALLPLLLAVALLPLFALFACCCLVVALFALLPLLAGLLLPLFALLPLLALVRVVPLLALLLPLFALACWRVVVALVRVVGLVVARCYPRVPCHSYYRHF
jgi:hypothetical protein